MKKTRFLVMVLTLFFIFSVFSGAVAAKEGVIKGSVITGKDELVEEAEVQLKMAESPDSGFQVKETTITSENGSFKFSDLNTSYFYKIGVKYNGNIFHSSSNLGMGMGSIPESMQNILSFSQGTSNVIKSDITVFDGVSDSSIMKIDYKHLIIQKTNSNLSVSEMVILNNTGDESFYGNLTISTLYNEEGEELVNNTKELGLGPQKTKNVTSSYTISFSDSFRLNQKINLRTSRYIILLDSSTLNGTNPSSNLMSIGTYQTQRGTYLGYIAGMETEGLSEGENVEITIKELEETTGPDNSTKEDSNLLIPLIIAALVVIGLIIYFKRDEIDLMDEETSTSDLKEQNVSEEEYRSLKRKKISLLKKIDRLDKKYENDEINERKYKKKRDEYKNEGKEVIKELEEKDSGMEERGTEEMSEPEKDLEEKKTELLDKISSLEARVERGDITEKEYEMLNKNYREKLREVMKKLEGD